MKVVIYKSELDKRRKKARVYGCAVLENDEEIKRFTTPTTKGKQDFNKKVLTKASANETIMPGIKIEMTINKKIKDKGILNYCMVFW